MMKFIITVAGAELATILAALRFYQHAGMADPAGGLHGKAELLTGIEAASSRPVRKIVVLDG